MIPLNLPTSAQMRELRERFDSVCDDLPRYELVEEPDAMRQWAEVLACCPRESRLGYIDERIEADEYGN